jgi:hypothetical protein
MPLSYLEENQKSLNDYIINIIQYFSKKIFHFFFLYFDQNKCLGQQHVYEKNYFGKY